MTKIALALAAAFLAGSAHGQEASPVATATAAPTPSPRSIRISFVPPPLDGTISLGVYDAKGKLVRVLFREADINEFNIGSDSLSTTWDGKDDAGADVPAGKYTLRVWHEKAKPAVAVIEVGDTPMVNVPPIELKR